MRQRHEGQAGPPLRLTGLPPVVSPQTVVLVLGSFPGAASLRLQQYYGHPQNQFWRILSAVWPQHPLPQEPGAYAARCEWLLARRLGVWDVYGSCLREGSLDSAIRDAQVNDFGGLLEACPALAAVAHNGGESWRHHAAVRDSLATSARGPAAGQIGSVRLPSTSPANAAISFARKFDAWKECLARYGLV
ncbi:DNA-deoxyinosine glycosylase [Acidovorax sp.]|uniref:DNA-deoxyinosine glycosylase n=1 Tax=Acidovorax sp. TaxID=1872122 RepID=UPI0025BC5F11|nr:DNA-deoxyinosine glycosylase [Acidovorax sp.]MDH4463875.1 DNA-deoxyinosine glycosylase [Acidovorax sp.]